MSHELAWYVGGALLVASSAAWYWSIGHRTAIVKQMPVSAAWLGLLIITGVACCVWSAYLERDRYSFDTTAEPVALAIAFDLSPSMLAVPDPRSGPDMLPRFERGKVQLLSFLRGLEERREPAIISLIGFASDAQVIMGWNRSVAEAREVIQYVLAPDLFASSGTSLENAVSALEDTFEMLPERLRDVRKLAIIVSDGEDTKRAASFGYALDQLAGAEFDVIAMQAGLLDRNEGVPQYDTVGQFTGFRRVGGEMYTKTSTATTAALAQLDVGRGLHVRAETPTAAERMLEFAVRRLPGTVVPDTPLLPVLGMFATVFLLCIRVLR